MRNIEFIKKGEELLALIIRQDHSQEGTEFFTPEKFPQQVGFVSKEKGEIIQAHTHRPLKREIYLTQEVLIIRKGRIKVDLYAQDKEYFDSRVLEAGDVILLVGGGHGYEALENVKMVEIKQGPYLGKDDRILL